MANACEVLPACDNLDGRLLLQRTIYGPQFGFDEQPALPGLGSAGAGLRPYADLMFGMTWRQVGLCQAPPTSVMGLAPGEVVTVGIRTRQSRSFTQLVRDAAESSQTISHSDRHTSEHGTQPVPPATGGGGGGGEDILGDIVKLAPIFIGMFGSIFSDALPVVGGIVGGILGGPVGAAIGGAAGSAVGGLIDNGIAGGGGGSGASPVVETGSITDEIINTITHSESQSHLRETNVSTAEESEQSIRRTFGNPYLDRTLQLRFIPVFNQFAVTVSLVRVTPGLVAHFAEPVANASLNMLTMQTTTAKMAIAERAAAVRPIAVALHAANQVGDDEGVRRPMAALLQRLSARDKQSRGTLLERGLSWDRTEVRGNGIHVPIASPDNVASAWKLRGEEATKFKKALGRIDAAQLDKIFVPRVRTVSVFAGTHVEAVPGSCVLPDVPADLKVIVPGATQYLREKE